MSIFLIIIWILFGLVTSGVFLHYFGDEYGDGDEWMAVMICLASWPILIIGYIGYVILKELSKFPIMIKGFLDTITKK